MNQNINWGIIGAGDVAEVKSGPAFNNISCSRLLAIARRNAKKAEDFAARHKVPMWYTDIDALLANSDINAIYVATPPKLHKEHAIKALRAGKHVYLEKPMAISEKACHKIMKVANEEGQKLSIAHYRRALPAFEKVKELLDNDMIGRVRFVNLQIFQPAKSDIIANSDENWRLNPSISGGGLFHDIAPHQIDLMMHYFGKPLEVSGRSLNHSQTSEADDYVCGQMIFKKDIHFNGTWSFSVDSKDNSKEQCEIYGAHGKISFSFYGDKITIDIGAKSKTMEFVNPVHIQQPMIERVVRYFQGEGKNPCKGATGAEVIRIMNSMTSPA